MAMQVVGSVHRPRLVKDRIEWQCFIDDPRAYRNRFESHFGPKSKTRPGICWPLEHCHRVVHAYQHNHYAADLEIEMTSMNGYSRHLFKVTKVRLASRDA